MCRPETPTIKTMRTKATMGTGTGTLRAVRPAEPNLTRDATFAAVERWVVRRLGSTDHERRVAAVAATLFDLAAPVHALDDSDRRLAQLAALVHDVGRCEGEEDHPADGAAMILAATSLPLTDVQRRQLAYLTLYH